MSEHKLDLILGALGDLKTEVREQGETMLVVVALLQAIPPYFETIVELLNEVLKLASSEPPGESKLEIALKAIANALTVQTETLKDIQTALLNLPDEVTSAVEDGVRLASVEPESDEEGPE